MDEQKKSNRALLPIILTVFIDMLGFGILIPVIPQLLANPYSKFYILPGDYTINQGYILLGFLTAIFPFMQFLATPILGELSDKFGRKKILALSLFGTSVSYIIFAIGILTKNLPLLFISRGFDGITGGNISVAMAAIADVTTPENRSKNFGLIGAAFGLGFILGPYMGGKLSDPTIVSWFDATTPFYFAALLSFLNMISVITIFPETLKNIQQHLQIHLLKSIQNIGKAFRIKGLLVPFISSFLLTSGFTFFTTFASVFFIKRFGWSQGNIGDYFSYVGLWIAITQAVITRQVASKFNESQVLKVTMLGTAVALAAFFLPRVGWQVLVITPIFSIFNGLTQANLPGLVSRSAPQEVQGEVLGITSSVQALAQTIPAVLSGYIAASISPEAPLLFGSLIIALAGAIFVIFYKAPENSTAQPAEMAMAH